MVTTDPIMEAAVQALYKRHAVKGGDHVPDDFVPDAAAVLATLTPLIEEAALKRWHHDIAYVRAAALANERKEIAEQARRYAGHYPEASDGRNTFVMLAEWIEARTLKGAVMTKPANINESKVVIVITDPKDDGGAMASTLYLRHSYRGITFTTIWPETDGSYASDDNVETVNSTVFGGIKDQP